MKEKKEKKEFGSPRKVLIVNSVTALRFLASFLIVPVFKTLGGLSAAVFAGVFMFTDWIDGFLARKFNASTFFGSIFDGATDKAFAILTFALLMTVNPLVFSVPLLMELAILVVQNKKMKKGLNVKSNMIGKIKTWILSFSMAFSLAAVELLNIKPLVEYIKTASLANVAAIEDTLALLGITLPAVLFQFLTLSSYNNELKGDKLEETPILREYTEEEVEVAIKEDNADVEALRRFLTQEEVEDNLAHIDQERNRLQSEYTFLEKLKLVKEKLFDPEYYAENKDKQIRTLTKELFTKKS